MTRRIASLLLLIGVTLGLAAPASAQDGKVHLLWLGQSCFRLTTPGGKNIMIDPFILKNPKTPAAWKDLGKLGKIDLVLVSHGHGDHAADAPAIVKMNHVRMWGPPGLADTMVQLGVLTAEEVGKMNKGGTITPLGPGIAITETHADHSSEFTYTDPATKKAQVYYGGEPVGFVIRLENGFTIYHTGDTALFSDMKLIGEIYKPDLMLVAIGGHYTMDPRAAALATKMVHPRYAIPMHYGTFPALKGTPAEYKAALGRGRTKVIVMEPGQTMTF